MTKTHKALLALALVNVETLREYAQESLSRHLQSLGEDRPRYKTEADQIREDIAAAKYLEKLLRDYLGMPSQPAAGTMEEVK